MYEDMNQPIPDVSRYLDRMGIGGRPVPTLENLNKLIWAHQTHIPFEDLNTSLLNRPVPLDIPTLFEKIVINRRGGYCYELNGLFTRLLLDLGYDARSVFCRVVRGRDFLPPCAHRGIVVALEGKLYFCDVGFGGPMPAGTLEIADGCGATIHGEYFRIDRFDEYWWTISRDTSDGVREAVLQFNTFPQLPQEFIAVNMKSAVDPDSIFVKQILVNLRTEDGALSITNDEFTIRTTQKVEKTTLPDKAALMHVLSEHFGIDNLA